MSYFNEERINTLYDICKNGVRFKNHKDSFCYKYENGICGKVEEFSIKDLNVYSGKADVIISLKRHGENSTYNIRDLGKDVDMLLSLLEKFDVDKSRVILQFDEFNFTNEDGPKYLRNEFTLQELKHTETILRENHDVDIFYSEYIDNASKISDYLDKGLLWKYKQIHDANLCIENLAQYIMKNKLSPLETIAFLSAFAYKNFEYNNGAEFNDDNLWSEKNNSIVNAVNYGIVRCVGYEQFFSAMVGELREYFDRNGYRLIDVGEGVVNCKESSSHAVSVIYIEDDKHDFNGKFLVDLNDTMINFIKRPLSDCKGYNGTEYIKVCGKLKNKNFSYTKFNTGEIYNGKSKKLTSKKKYDALNQTSCLVSNKKRMKRSGYSLLSEDLLKKSTQDYVNEDTIRDMTFSRIPWEDKDFKRLNLNNMSFKKITKKVMDAYDEINDLQIPTVSEILKLNESYERC